MEIGRADQIFSAGFSRTRASFHPSFARMSSAPRFLYTRAELFTLEMADSGNLPHTVSKLLL
jgi:hypothetical protein